jgi:hypothetical protein
MPGRLPRRQPEPPLECVLSAQAPAPLRRAAARFDGVELGLDLVELILDVRERPLLRLEDPVLLLEHLLSDGMDQIHFAVDVVQHHPNVIKAGFPVFRQQKIEQILDGRVLGDVRLCSRQREDR